MKVLLIILGMGACLSAQTATPRVLGQSALVPVANSLRAGSSGQFDATASVCSGGCLYFWTQTAGPSTLQWASRTASQPTVTNIAFGEYSIRLRVTAISGGATAVTDLAVGAVGTDVNGNVAMPAQFQDVVGPATRHGVSPWNYQDFIGTGYLDSIITLNAGAEFNGLDWDTPLPGTVSAVAGSTAITGVGTSFQTRYCSGGTTTPNSDFNVFVLKWTDTAGNTRNRYYPVSSCPTQTSLVLQYAVESELAGQPLTGVQHSYIAVGGRWYGGSDNVNYYDNCAAFQIGYERTGLTRYLTESNRLCALWWRSPAIDRATRSTGPLTPPFRLRQFAGVMWWAVRTGQTQASFWNYMESYLDANIADLNTVSILSDLRETAYFMGWYASAAILSPTKSATYKSALIGAANAWSAVEQPGGTWQNVFYSTSTGGVQVAAGTVTVTTGSPVVTLTGSTFSASVCTPSTGLNPVTFQVFGNSTGSVNDTVAYTCTYNSPTQITLSANYAGLYSGSGRNWNIGVLTGLGMQPFIAGLVATEMAIAANATTGNTSVLWQSMALKISNWINTSGRQPGTKGLYYTRLVTVCEQGAGITAAPVAQCQYYEDRNNPDGIWDSRFIILEGLHGMAESARRSGSATLATANDELSGSMFGKTGFTGPYVDGNDARALYEGAVASASSKNKDLGFCCGVGNMFSWTSFRNGGPIPAVTENYTTPYISLRGSDSMVITVTATNGRAATITCTTGTCIIPVDTVRGSVQAQIDWKLGGVTVLRGNPFQIVT